MYVQLQFLHLQYAGSVPNVSVELDSTNRTEVLRIIDRGKVRIAHAQKSKHCMFVVRPWHAFNSKFYMYLQNFAGRNLFHVKAMPWFYVYVSLSAQYVYGFMKFECIYSSQQLLKEMML